MKTCTKCHIEKDNSEFRLRLAKKGDTKYHLSPSCKECEKKYRQEAYQKKRLSLSYKLLMKQRAKMYGQKEKCRLRKKEYEAKNVASISASKRKYGTLHKDKITNEYVIHLLRTQGYGTVEEITKNKELVELKKSEVLLSRLKKKMYVRVGENKICPNCNISKDKSEFYLMKDKTRSNLCMECEKERSRSRLREKRKTCKQNEHG